MRELYELSEEYPIVFGSYRNENARDLMYIERCVNEKLSDLTSYKDWEYIDENDIGTYDWHEAKVIKKTDQSITLGVKCSLELRTSKNCLSYDLITLYGEFEGSGYDKEADEYTLGGISWTGWER